MHYTQVEEILLDDSFYCWYLQTVPAHVRRWNDWRLKNAQNQVLIEQAVSALNSLLNQKDEEGHPRHIHAIHSRLQRARAMQPDSTDENSIPDNRASISGWNEFDINLS